MDALLTIQQLAKLLSVSTRMVESMILRGEAPAFIRMGRLRRWDPQVVKAWLEQKKRGNAEASTPNSSD